MPSSQIADRRVPGAAQRNVAVRCRTGTVTTRKVPALRCTVALRSTLHRVRDTLPGFIPP